MASWRLGVLCPSTRRSKLSVGPNNPRSGQKVNDLIEGSAFTISNGQLVP
jgi:hypothetical protein